jgi:hypothetical protein
MQDLTKTIRRRGETPFFHMLDGNQRAIALYEHERLGLVMRAKFNPNIVLA